MIPKIIHYCWFGGNPKPEIIERCIASWRKYCPEWDIIEWNESNFDVNSYKFTKQAYDCKKWAFVSDVVRLDAIIKYGGIYLDTDVEILTSRPFDDLLKNENIVVFETERAISTGLCLGGCENSKFLQALLEPYFNMNFTNENQMVNFFINKPVFDAQFPNLKWDGQTQVHYGTYIMGVDEYGKRMKHYGTRTWCDDLPDFKISGFWRLKKFLRNPKFINFLEKNVLLKKLAPIYIFLVYDFFDLGPIYYVKRIAMKVKRKFKI